jgi:hypothetical protein
MNLEEAIEKFQAKRKGRFSPDDKQLIVATAGELNLSNFEIKQRLDVKTKNGDPYSVYIYDVEDIVHFHPTMIVSRTEFDGRDLERKSKYKPYPHFAELSNWIIDEKNDDLICPECFLVIPLVGICGSCGFNVEEFEI